MDKWISVLLSCFNVSGNEKKIKRSFTLLDNGALGAAEVISARDMAAYGWESDNCDYIMAAASAEPADELSINEAVSDAVSRLVGNKNAELYAARDVIIDDMLGFEVCGGVELSDNDEESIFYCLFLSDSKSGYLIIGFGSAEAAVSFDELCGASRTFHRGKSPVIFNKGKSEKSLFKNLRSLIKKLIPDDNYIWDIINVTFDVKDGKPLEPASVNLLSEKGMETFNQSDIYEGRDISAPLSLFSSELQNIYDIAGFTVTLFRNGVYSVTFYPLMEEEEEETEESDNCSCGHYHEHKHSEECMEDDEDDDGEDGKYKFLPLCSAASKLFPDDWKYGMGIISSDGNYLNLCLYYSKGSSFISAEIPEESGDDELSAHIEDIGHFLDENEEKWNFVYFIFEKGNDNSVNDDSITYNLYNFNVFIDAEDMEADEKNDYLLPMADVFYEEINEGTVPAACVEFSIAFNVDGDDPFIIEPSIGDTPSGVCYMTSYSKYSDVIYKHLKELILKIMLPCNVVRVTIFPGSQVGFTLSFEDTDIISRSDLNELIASENLSRHKKEILLLARDDIAASAYSVINEDSLFPCLSRLGGEPDLPSYVPYPLSEKGRPMLFVGQVDLNDIYPYANDMLFSSSGLLSFFYDEETDKCRVLYNADNFSAFKRTPPPSHINSKIKIMLMRLRFAPSVSIPCLNGVYTEKLKFLGDEEKESYDILTDYFSYMAKMFGFPKTEHSDYDIDSKEEPILLFQVSCENGEDIGFHDGGTLYFWINKDDLKKHRFDKCWCVYQE